MLAILFSALSGCNRPAVSWWNQGIKKDRFHGWWNRNAIGYWIQLYLYSIIACQVLAVNTAGASKTGKLGKRTASEKNSVKK